MEKWRNKWGCIKLGEGEDGGDDDDDDEESEREKIRNPMHGKSKGLN